LPNRGYGAFMANAEPTADCTYEELVRIYRENCGLADAGECRRALKALRQLALIQPSETEQAGDRMTMRDIEKRIEEASDAAAVFGLASQKATVIVPSDDLGRGGSGRYPFNC
jgi:hypothetical protein